MVKEEGASLVAFEFIASRTYSLIDNKDFKRLVVLTTTACQYITKNKKKIDN